MQSLNILMAVIQIGIMMNVVSRLTHIKGFAECTESELNRMTDKILNGIVFCGMSILASLLACLVVYKFNSKLGLIAQFVFTAAVIFRWVSQIKEVTKFEMTLLKRRVDRVGREKAVARLYKNPPLTDL